MTGRPTQPRLAFEPLFVASHCDSLMALSKRISASLAAVTRWKREGIPFFSADQAAADLDLHPILVWGDDYLVVGA